MDVTVGDERFDRYYRRIRLALRMMSHRARPQVVSEWSGLTTPQLETLKERWLPELGKGFRGDSPTSFYTFFRSAAKGAHATLFVSIFQVVGICSTAPSLEGGERLCEAYEIYRTWEPDSTLKFDYALLLAMGSLTKEQIELTNCTSCASALLIDKRGTARRECAWCRGGISTERLT